MGFSERLERFVLWIAFVLIVPVYGFSLYNQIAMSPSLDGRPFWFFCGALLTAIVCLIKPPSLFWMVWAHETTHSVVFPEATVGGFWCDGPLEIWVRILSLAKSG